MGKQQIPSLRGHLVPPAGCRCLLRQGVREWWLLVAPDSVCTSLAAPPHLPHSHVLTVPRADFRSVVCCAAGFRSPESLLLDSPGSKLVCPTDTNPRPRDYRPCNIPPPPPCYGCTTFPRNDCDEQGLNFDIKLGGRRKQHKA